MVSLTTWKLEEAELENGTIAVKRMFNTHMHEREFNREIECPMQVKHKNIARFLGYCADTQGRMEIYNGQFVMADVQQRLTCFEYIPNGSLDEYIKDPSSGLEWRKRYKIIKGICEGLNYLHQKKILHLDLKPTNILLDEDMTPKFIDFGLSRCLKEGETRVFTSNIAGTIGYLAPEFTRGVITYKFDLYSLGVIIGEILTGRKGYQTVEEVLESWCNWSDESQLEQIRVCVGIGMECIEYNPGKRPESINHIIDRLLVTESTMIIPAGGPSELLVLDKLALSFPFEPNMVITCPLQLTNNTDKHVAFRLKENTGKSFLRLPLYGIVTPRSLYTLDVTMEEHRELPQKRNMYMILDSATILGDDVAHIFESQPDDFFKTERKTGNVVQIILKAFYTLHHDTKDPSKIGSKSHHLSSGDTGSKPLDLSFDHIGSKPNHLAFQHLKDITDNFSDKRILGKGGFGVVYKGVLQSGQVVAVKKLVMGMPTSEKQFENEVNLLMKLEHPNIVQLVGYCYETVRLHTPHEGEFVFAENTESLLCLECLPNGSLDKYISDASSGLDWRTRWKIIEGVSFGLQYLHEQPKGPIVHLDLKPANILLDKNMVPKIADFGLSRLFDEKQNISTALHGGTLGYMPPEFTRGKLTLMSDIFSLGVIILEVITGHKEYPYDIRTESKDFIEHELQKWRNVLQEEPTSSTLLDMDSHQIERCIQIGLICVNLERSRRPTMKKIIDMLQGSGSIDWYITNELSCHDIQEEP
ncbi:hypothetical protein CFC21_106208 [Triticum aestivum]|uniref:non-specific serine/threonine protein kinase n=2 Tax=Triticum aestivum TaxID=4565 RepID=A0A3B6SM96_WHEAT|nr:uncharacterized protein LOC123162479 [Triticum aestivum]KAF7105395.1 hypothetical protein CFC21_106208 [Triticum aestivum]